MKLNKFLLSVIKNDENIKPELSFKNIITSTLKGKDKCTEFGSYDAESLLAGKIIPGNIYRFTYKANEQTKFKVDNEHTLEWSDSYPIVLVTYVDKDMIKGVNFNLCNKAVKSGILNMMTNIDPDFYEFGAEELVADGKFPVSESTLKLILSGEIENMLVKSLNIDYNTIFRHYKILNIANMRFIEYWQWKYLPYLNYNGSIKGDVLKIIQHVTGIDHYKM